jgi:hypothetical protein
MLVRSANPERRNAMKSLLAVWRKRRSDQQGKKLRPARTKVPCRLHVECLEQRCVPSTVTNLADSGSGSLRDAIANTTAGGTVDFQPGLAGTITLTSGPLSVAQDLTIAGPTTQSITVSGNQASQVFVIAAGSTVTIADLTITQGFTDGTNGRGGGGIDNAGTLTLTSDVVSNNKVLGPLGANDGLGGGIYNTGTLTLTNSTVSNNQAVGSESMMMDIQARSAFGGGIYSTGTLTVSTSSVNNNSATGGIGVGIPSTNGGAANGGGIFSTGPLAITNSTVAENTAKGDAAVAAGTGAANGGGVYSIGTLTASNSTFASNAAVGAFAEIGQADGGGLFLIGGTATLVNDTIADNTLNNSDLGSTGVGLAVTGPATAVLQNTLVAANTVGGFDFAVPSDVSGAVSSTSSHNLLGVGGTSGLTGGVNGNRVGLSTAPLNPRLGPLQNNGGSTLTLALLLGSPAIDAGDNTLSPGPTDQRGQPRIAGREIDIGAYEFQAPAGLMPFFALGGSPGRVQLRRVTDGSLLDDFTPFPAPYAGSVAVAVGDVTGDGYPDLIVGAAEGNPHVKIYDGKAIALGIFDPANPDASLVTTFFAYGVGFNIGVNVAVGDVTGDGYPDIVTGPTAGNPHVKVYNGKAIATGTFDAANPDASLVTSFFAYDLNFNVGANVAVGDVTGDGYGEVVTGPTVGNPHVKVYDGKAIATGAFNPFNPDASLLASFFGEPFLGDNIGAFVAVGDNVGDGYGDVVVGATMGFQATVIPAIRVYSGQAIAGQTFDNSNPQASLVADFAPYPGAISATGSAVAAADFDADGKADVLLGLHQGSPSYRVIDGLTNGTPTFQDIVNGISGIFPVVPNNIFVAV